MFFSMLLLRSDISNDIQCKHCRLGDVQVGVSGCSKEQGTHLFAISFWLAILFPWKEGNIDLRR